VKEERGSFLKKRTKKLLVLRALASALPTPPISKSFLLLFVKKEVLAYLSFSRCEKMDCFATLAMTA
jgi:hypothetical protein